ncbi:MAG: type I restriction endonuclease [Prevotella melaninogenica]
MSISKTNEQAFEELIEKSLVGMTVEERHGNVYVDSQQPDDSHFYWGKPKDMDSKLAIDLRRLWSFLKTTQVDALEELKGLSLDDIPKQIAKQIDAFGVVDVLRNGVKINNIHLTLFYPKPSAADSDLSKVQYGKNQFSVTRQQTFSLWNPGLGIDMVVFVNGIPLFTLELKNPWTHQTAHYDGERQYKSKERSPKDPLLKFGHCLAHFTVDKNEAYFTTKLALDKTYFMPFNQGIPDGQGGGNPSQPDMGYRTKYLWENVLVAER